MCVSVYMFTFGLYVSRENTSEREKGTNVEDSIYRI